ncbi:MAG: metallopeptidase family protein [Alphaproteobacteria bacterium]|nr:metallopeptidase family protein [Alphaproteobacteria bacterium]
MTTTRRFGPPPSDADLHALADGALAALPAAFRRLVQGVAILIEEFPAEDVIESMGLESGYDLLGLYQGVSLDQKSVTGVAHDVDRILLYRAPILLAWAEGEDALEDLVRNTLIHEIGHHFGLSDDDMARLEGAV